MINKILLKQKLHEKKVLEIKMFWAYKSNNYYMVRELIYDLMLVENDIKELQNK